MINTSIPNLSDDPALMAEHMAAMQLLKPADASHVAVKSGNWSDKGTWAGGRIPGEGADVHIPEGITLRYDVESNASLHYVRVDGTLNWATNTDTKMLVDTVIGTGTSTITLGNADRPMNADVEAQIIIADNGKIDLAEDAKQLSRGVVLHGEVEIHGATKQAYLVAAEAPRAGDTTLSLEGDLTNWNVGDSLVVIGVEQNGENSKGQLLTQDEERTITAIKADGTIVLDRALVYDHTPPAGYDFDVYVGNQTRNVTFSSENPDGVRGHVMVMHADGADIRYAAFDDLGRTDVSNLRGTEANPDGRYPLHLHRSGVDEGSEIATLVGNAVSGGPGWGIVQHESNAAVDHNFVYDIQGAGIVSERGNETGQWIGNLVSSTYGDGEKLDHIRDEKEGQFGHAGVAYESQSRLIIQQDNIAASSKYGWTFRATEIFHTDGSDELALDRATVQFDPDPTGKHVVGEEAQIMAFTGNEAIAVDVAFDSGHRVGITQETNLHSQIFDFTVWNSSRVIDLMNYTGNYVIKDSTFVNGFQAVFLAGKHEGTNLINVVIDGFDESIVNGGYNSDGVLVDVDIKNSKTPFITRDGKPMEILDGDSLKMLDAPIIKIDPGSDLVMEKGSNDELFIKGTITDSAGTYGFGQNRWIDQPHSISDGLTVRFNERKFLTYDEAFELHGTMQQADGSWIMPVVFWISDRVTGEPHPHVVEIDVKGFDTATMKKYQISEVTIPDTKIEIIDTLAQSNNAPAPVNAPDVETPVVVAPQEPEPTKPEPEVSEPTVVAPVEPKPVVSEPAAPKPPAASPEVDGRHVFSLFGDRQFDGSDKNVINIAHSDAYEIANGAVSLTFNAADFSKLGGLFSKDATGLGGGGHISASVRKGNLDVRFQTDTDSLTFSTSGIKTNKDYDLQVVFGEDGISASLDGVVFGADDGFATTWEHNTEHLQIGALGKWSGTGTGDFAAAFVGEISDVVITDTDAAAPAEVPAPTAPAPAPAPDDGEGGVFYSLDRLDLNGRKDSIVNLAHDEEFEQESVHISLTFNADHTDKYRGIISKDASGYGDGGHLSAAVRNGTLEVRFQNETDEKKFYVKGIEANRDYDLDLSLSDDGILALLDGVEIGRDDDFEMSWEENNEAFQIGALGKWSDAGKNDTAAYFKGEITDVEISSQPLDDFGF